MQITERVSAVIAEFLGTFVLVFAGCGAVAIGQLAPAGVATAFGLAIAVMIYAFGHVSGAHFNPAVSIAFAVGRHFPWRSVALYVPAQVLGATSAAALLSFALGAGGAIGVTRPMASDGQALLFEVVLTFVLMLVITAVATDTRAVGEAAALAIGGAVALGALVGGPVSGASMNPARSIGPALVAGDFASLWVYVVGPLGGSVLAVLAYRYLRGAPEARRS